MKKLFSVLTLFSIGINANAQLQYDWHHASTDTNAQWISDMEYGDQNELYIVGHGWVGTDLDYSAATVMSSTNYIAVYSHAGTYLRNWTIPGATFSGLTIAGNGDVIAHGTFGGTVDFDPSPVFSTTLNGGNYSFFVARYTKMGVFLWVRAFESRPNSIPEIREADESMNVVTIGLQLNYYGVDTIDLDPGPGNVYNISTGWMSTAAIVRLNSTGNFIWSTTFDNVIMWDMTTNGASEIAFGGRIVDTVDFDPGAGVIQQIPSLPSQAAGDWFYAHYDSWGGYIKHYCAGSTAGYGNCAEIHLNNGGEIYVNGMLPPGADIDPGAATLTFPNNFNYVFAKFNTNGSLAWTLQDVRPFTVNDAAGTVYLYDVSGVHCYSASGTPLWSLPFLLNVYPNIIALSQNDKLCITGSHQSSDDFDPGAGTITVPGNAQDFKLSLDDPLATIPEIPETSISLSPNPASDVINITCTECSGTYSIINFIGETVKTGTYISNHVAVNIADLPDGVYFFRDEERAATRFVVSH